MADATKQGSVYAGEFMIFLVYSLVEAITMNLHRCSDKEEGIASNVSHIEDAKRRQIPTSPLLFIVFESWIHRIYKLADDWNCPSRPGEVSLFCAIYSLLKDEKR